MGVFCVRFDVSTVTAQILLNIFSGKLIKRMLSYYIPSEQDDDDGDSPFPAPKEKLVLTEYGRLLEGDGECAICLGCIEAKNKVRELGNCCHVFHKHCIDVWIDHGKLTCPLCRSKLFPDLIKK